jgi:tetratricopeptide (TPR) repeat protein
VVDFDGTVEFQGINRFGVGVEYAYRSQYFLRAGYQFHEQVNEIQGLQDLTVGAGILWNGFQLDYAYLPYGDLGASNRISLNYIFPESAPPPKPTATPVQTPDGSAATFKPAPGMDQHPLTLQFDVPPDAAAEGEAPEAQGDLGQALKTYEEETQKDPGDFMAWDALGKVYFKMGLKTDAIRCFEQFLKLKPDQKAIADWLKRYKEAP